jgi:hypothetical protein
VRDSDRWITPRVVVAMIAAAVVVVLAALAAVTYLAARGVDPDPVLKTVGQLATGVGSLLTLVFTLHGRRGVAKVERNTGLLTNALHDVADIIDERTTRPVGVPPVPGRGFHAAPDTGAAPAVRGS